MKFKTVREGDQAVILNHLGQGRLVEGPERVSLRAVCLKSELFYHLHKRTTHSQIEEFR